MAEWVETCRGAVSPWQCDVYGHMNVQHHMAALSDADFGILVHLGFGPRTSAARGLGMSGVHFGLDISAELRAGDPWLVQSTVGRVGTKSLTFAHRMRNPESGQEIMTAEIVMVPIDMEARASRPLPDDLRAAAAAMMAAAGS